jgi:hypothetical protein
VTDKLDNALPKIKQMLLVILDQGSSDGERINAAHAARRYLTHADSDSHELVEQLLTETDMQKILDAGREQGRAEEVKNARRDSVTIGAPFDVGSGVGPYSWLQIARHCERNGHRLNTWEREFAASLARRLLYKPPSPNQASKLHDIFHKRFGERI